MSNCWKCGAPIVDGEMECLDCVLDLMHGDLCENWKCSDGENPVAALNQTLSEIIRSMHQQQELLLAAIKNSVEDLKEIKKRLTPPTDGSDYQI
jgi:hypothetical protein